MNQQTTKKSLTNRKLMSLCMKYYLSEINGTLLMLFVILTSTITRRISNFFLKKTIYNLSSSESILSNVLKIYALSFLYSCLSSGNDFMLTSFLGIFQHNISIKALHKILTYEAAGQIDLSSGRTQYAISEGSKAMGKLFKHLFVDFVTKVTYLATDIFLINNRLGLVHVFFAIGVALISTAIHLKGAMITIQCKKELNDARGECDKIIYEDIINYETIKSYRTEDLQLEKYKERIRPWRNAYLKHERVKILLAFIHDTIFATTALLFNLYFWKVGTTKQELYKDTYFCLRDLEASIENTSGMYRKYREALVTSNMLIYYLDLIEGFSSGSTIKDSFTDKIVFDNVDFHLGSVSILRKLNFELLRGDKKVIYGRNGSGKSTLFRLMMRLAHQNSGLITIDGININEIEINAYRKLFTYVPQETNLFDDSVINNLTHGNNQSYSEVLKECKKMNIHDDIMRLESGYNTIVGERGCNLNGGLRQKIFYVRAFAYRCPHFTI
ncbi:ATP-binding cassette sub-family B member 7, mitochondrial [Nosema bombycis CQ1]|uniref:ATP-binding cassette sub-family B member 7, mitochondrial n=1 Tax=Nosema bombycis (strain CQ1 / CVCC 102059) TaxID=578461 RepID=R0M6Q6_NOSB1|nr:ATP-binding cassette sub-family B member 7, mitochondrial [Nosema bombycis CQ1]|eukprot:EOB13689.1 ATP-binding cassette sub-family B member 7, mitochondrial [Nosema bombycis CQ1]